MLTLKIAFLLIAYSLACLCFGRGLLRLLRIDLLTSAGFRPATLVATSFLLGQGAFASVWVLIALAGWFSPPIVFAVIVASLVFGWGRFRLDANLLFGQMRSVWHDLLGESWAWRLIAILTVLLLLLPSVSAGLPLQGDALSLYMTLPKVIAGSHHLSVLPGPGGDGFAFLGLQGEMHYAALMSLGSPDAARMFSWITVLAGAVMLVSICDEARLGRRGRLIALAMMISSSAVLLFAADGKVDMFPMALGLAACYWAMKPDALSLTGLFAGFAIVAKVSYLGTLPVVILVLLVWPYLHRNGEFSRLWPMARTLLIVAAWTGVAIIPHLIKNGVLLGDPLAFYGNWNIPVFPSPTGNKITFTFPLNLTFYYIGNPSPLFLAFFPLFLFLPKPKSMLDSPLARITVAALIGMLIWVLLFPSFTLRTRYYLTLMVLFIPLAARAAEHVTRQDTKPRILSGAIITAILITVYSATQYFAISKYPPHDVLGYLRGHNQGCDLHGPGCRAMSVLNKEAEPGARVLSSAVHTYYLRADLLQCVNAEYYRKGSHKNKTAEDIWKDVYKAGYHYVLADGRYTDLLIARVNIANPPPWVRLIPLYNEGSMSVYRIKYPDAPGKPAMACNQVRPPAWDVVEVAGDGPDERKTFR